ncbi:MAG: CBS domain-containing protein [Acidimicrobiia bacterium]|nr:CBS domain-containing protein [Acidimicrobiia bacterium]
MKVSEETPQSVSDVMTADLVAVLPEDHVGRARDLMLSVGIHAIPVMEGNDVVGIVTSTDLIDDWPDEEPLTSILTPVPTSIHIDASIQEAAEVMISQRIHHLLVADDREVVGILSSFDLLGALTRS